jgi:hypothetical protein
MLVTTGRPKLWQTAGLAWRGLFAALPRMALLFIIGYVLLVGLDLATGRVTTLLSIPTHDALQAIVKDNRRLPALGLWEAIALDLAVAALRAVILAPIAVAMHRFVLLDETRRIFFVSRLTLRFAAWLWALAIPVMVLRWLMLLGSSATGLVPMLSVLLFAYVIVLIQTLPLFPSVAVEEHSRDISGRLETALERAERMFLLTVGALVLTLLPIILARVIAARAFVKLAQKLPLLAPLAGGVATIISIALGAMVISMLYSYSAHRPAAPPEAQPAPAS